MTADIVRTGAERKDHALALLRARHAEVWVASASADGAPHLVPLSRIQVWRSLAEHSRRTVMRAGRWLA
jgi:hypothetical protein